MGYFFHSSDCNSERKLDEMTGVPDELEGAGKPKWEVEAEKTVADF